MQQGRDSMQEAMEGMQQGKDGMHQGGDGMQQEWEGIRACSREGMVFSRIGRACGWKGMVDMTAKLSS